VAGSSRSFEGAVGMLGPIELAEFRDFLNLKPNESLPLLGMGGTPVNLLCRELLRRGRRLVVFSCDVRVDSEIVFEGELIRIYIGPYTRRRARTFFSKERKFLARAMSREKLSVLHAQWTYEYALAAIDSDLPHVVTAHDAPLNCLWHNPIPYRAVKTLMAYKAARTAKRLVAVSPYVAEHLRRYRLRTKPVQVVPNGMPNALFARMRRDQPGRPFTFATVLSAWGGHKNGGAAIAAFSKVRGIMPGAAMLMFGAGHDADGPAAVWARERGFHDGIEFMGQVPHADLLDIVAQRVDVLVHPALEEAHPMPVIEAMSLGIPVVGGKTAGGVPWTLGNGEYGILVDTHSPDQIAAAMIRLAQNDHARVELALAARESARRRFHIEHVTDCYEEIYAELAGAAAHTQ